MAEENVNKLSQKMIQDEYSKYKETVEIDFEEDDEIYRVTLTPYFKPEKINNVLQNFSKDLNEIYEKDINFPDNLLTVFILYHTLIEFSDFPRSKSKDIKKRVSFFTQVINTRYFEACVNTFIHDEFNKVFDKVMEVLKVSDQLDNLSEEGKQALSNMDIQNSEVHQHVNGVPKPNDESDDDGVS